MSKRFVPDARVTAAPKLPTDRPPTKQETWERNWFLFHDLKSREAIAGIARSEWVFGYTHWYNKGWRKQPDWKPGDDVIEAAVPPGPIFYADSGTTYQTLCICLEQVQKREECSVNAYDLIDPKAKRYIRDSVRRGAERLDSEYPGWEDEIDLERFDISSGNACICGQLFGDWWSKETSKFLNVDDVETDYDINGPPPKFHEVSARFGFSLREQEEDEQYIWDWLALQWSNRILDRRFAKAAA